MFSALIYILTFQTPGRGLYINLLSCSVQYELASWERLLKIGPWVTTAKYSARHETILELVESEPHSYPPNPCPGISTDRWMQTFALEIWWIFLLPSSCLLSTPLQNLFPSLCLFLQLSQTGLFVVLIPFITKVPTLQSNPQGRPLGFGCT